MIQIRQNGEVLADDLDSLRAEFQRQQCVLLPELVEPKLVRYMLDRIDAARMVTKFELNGEAEFGRVLFMPDTEPALFIFRLMLNNRKLFEAIEEVTGCQPIGNFLGRIHRSIPGANHQIAWHGDNTDHRLIGLTMELGDGDYTGGCFQLRKKDSEEILCEVPRKRAGDAFVFRIAPNLQHRLTMIEHGGPRTVGVGWFRSSPDIRTFAKQNFQFSSLV